MSISKVRYWNNLRNSLNKWLLLLGVVIILVVAVFYGNNETLNLIVPNQRFSLLIYTLINFLIYLAFVNTFILVFEMIDRTLNFNERKMLNKFFKWTAKIFFIGVLLVQIILLILNKIN